MVEVQYENLNGLLVLCMTAGLVEVDAKKRKWVMTSKFNELIEDAVLAGMADEAKSEPDRDFFEGIKCSPKRKKQKPKSS